MAGDKFDEIHEVLKELHGKHDDIESCMVVRKGLEGVVVFPDDFIERVSTVWDPMKDVIDSILELVADNSMYGLEKSYVEMLGYGILFCVIGMTDTSLVTFVRRKEGSETLEGMPEKLSDILIAKKRIEEIAEG